MTTTIRNGSFAALVLAGLLASALALAGCGGTPKETESAGPAAPDSALVPLPTEPPAPAAPPADSPTFDYTQRPIAEMTESERAEYIERRFRVPAGIADSVEGPSPPGSPPGEKYEHGYRIPGVRPGLPLASRIEEDPRLWSEIGPGYSPYAQQYPDGTYVDERRYEPFPFANTLVLGTLGGVIGHQSDDTEEGILIGAGTGLLLDMMRW